MWTDNLLPALFATLRQLTLLFVVPISISILIYLSERIVTGWFIRTTGFKGIWLTAWLGTPVHESAHAIICFIFRCPIKEIRFFIPDPESQVLGYVKYTHNPKNPFHWIGRWFIGLAPLFAGSAFLFGLLMLTGAFPITWRPDLLPGHTSDWISVVGLHFDTLSLIGSEMVSLLSTSDFWGNPLNWFLIYAALAVVTHMAPSFADLKGTFSGWILMLFLTFLMNYFILFLGVPVTFDSVLHFISLILTRLLALALVLSAINLIFWFIILNVIHRLKTGYWLMGRKHKG
ncbi:hypothetical protein [Accumulibacter sp.]|uniref:hypothetical protein n=1 Tax=Accumulibacter sp. TaxID=2053492 RepID=UPI001AD28294|nr:hypothetical protein [Accumulibacter sp.]MBN8707347.1 hypothetical protein [Bacteroidota bacterium]